MEKREPDSGGHHPPESASGRVSRRFGRSSNELRAQNAVRDFARAVCKSGRPPRTPNPLRDEIRASLRQQAFDTAIDLGGGNGLHFARTHFVAAADGFVSPLAFEIGIFQAGEQMFGEKNSVLGRKLLHGLSDVFQRSGHHLRIIPSWVKTILIFRSVLRAYGTCGPIPLCDEPS